MSFSSCRLLHSEKNVFLLSVVNLSLTSLYNPPIVMALSSIKKCEAEEQLFPDGSAQRLVMVVTQSENWNMGCLC